MKIKIYQVNMERDENRVCFYGIRFSFKISGQFRC